MAVVRGRGAASRLLGSAATQRCLVPQEREGRGSKEICTSWPGQVAVLPSPVVSPWCVRGTQQTLGALQDCAVITAVVFCLIRASDSLGQCVSTL